MKPLIPCLVKMYKSGKKYQYTGFFKSTWDAVADAKARFGHGHAFATPLSKGAAK